MKDGSRLADSQPNHVEFEGRMIPLSIPIVAVSRKDGLLLARGEHACTIGYDGGWQAARTVNFILKRLQQFESGDWVGPSLELLRDEDFQLVA